MKHVYCIEALDDRTLAYKIGVASHVGRRVAEMQTSNHALLRIVTDFPCHHDTRVESFLHSLLTQFHIRGEWFRPEPFVRDAMLRCADVFRSLTEEQNVVLCGTLTNDGWLYRHIKGWSNDPLPAWLRAAA